MVCPRGSCFGESIPVGWFDQKNCCTSLNQFYQWVLPHPNRISSGREVYEPCIGKSEDMSNLTHIEIVLRLYLRFLGFNIDYIILDFF
jgi:hypothetical protein